MTYHVWIEDKAIICNDRFGRVVPDGVRAFRAETLLDMYNLMELASIAMKTQREFCEIVLTDIELLELRGNTIDNLVKRVDELIAEKEVLQATVNRQAMAISSFKLSLTGIRTSVERWFSTIATDLLIGSTHRERNELYRGIGRGMHSWLQYPHENEDMDDIPF